MNTIKTFTLAASIIFASANVMADSGASNGHHLSQSNAATGHHLSQSNSTKIYTKATQNKQQSYLLGLNKLDDLESSTVKELEEKLNVLGQYKVVTGSFYVQDGSYITVQERMNSQGNSEYVSAVNVTYHYHKKERNNR